MKRGFSLIMAIVFIVVIITIGMLSFTLSNTSVKQTTEQYLSEQAEALAISASEYAIYKIQDNNFSKDYLNNVNIKSGVLSADVSIKYINTKSKTENSKTDFADKDNKIRAVILTTVVKSDPDIIKDQNIRYVRITTQKP